MKLLSINFGGLGDELLFLPTLKTIKKAHPDWHITLLCEPRSKSIAQLSSLIDDCILFDIKKVPLRPSDLLDLVLLLRRGNYNIVVSSGSSSRVAVLLFLSGIRIRIGFDSGALSRVLLTKAVPLNKEQYAAAMYEDLVQGLDLQVSKENPQIEVDPASIEKMSNFLSQNRAQAGKAGAARKLVLIHPGTSKLALQKGIIKTWPAANWTALISRLLAQGHEVVLCGGPDDDESIAAIKSLLEEEKTDQKPGVFLSAYGHTASIQDLAALFTLADLIVCVDSAPMHIAAALNKRLIALFGPTDPKKLLPTSSTCIAICQSRPENEKTGKPATASAESSPVCEPGVQIPLDTVYRTVLDQLSQVSVPESSLESR